MQRGLDKSSGWSYRLCEESKSRISKIKMGGSREKWNPNRTIHISDETNFDARQNGIHVFFLVMSVLTDLPRSEVEGLGGVVFVDAATEQPIFSWPQDISPLE